MFDKSKNAITPSYLTDKEYENMFNVLDEVAIDIIQLQGMIAMIKVLSQFKDKKEMIPFDYIETYVKNKAYKAKKQKIKVDNVVEKIIKQYNLENCY